MATRVSIGEPPHTNRNTIANAVVGERVDPIPISRSLENLLQYVSGGIRRAMGSTLIFLARGGRRLWCVSPSAGSQSALRCNGAKHRKERTRLVSPKSRGSQARLVSRPALQQLAMLAAVLERSKIKRRANRLTQRRKGAKPLRRKGRLKNRDTSVRDIGQQQLQPGCFVNELQPQRHRSAVPMPLQFLAPLRLCIFA